MTAGRPRWLVATPVLLALALAGCAGPSRPATHAEPPTGWITGSVVDDLDRPIGEATVLAPALGIATVTDASGAFALGPLAPGGHDLRVTAPGHRAREATVVLGAAPADVSWTFVLAPDLPKGTHQVTLEQRGLFGCGTSWRPAVVYSGVAACGYLEDLPVDTHGLDRFLLGWTLHEPVRDWHGVVFEMQWHSTQVLGHGLTFRWELDGCVNSGQGDFGSATGRSPVRLMLDGRDGRAHPREVAADGCGLISCVDERCRIVSRVFADAQTVGPTGPADVGASVEQPFAQYLTAFYGGPVPEGYTALR